MKTDKEELFYRLALTSLPNIGYILGKTLYSYFGSASAIFKASKNQLERVPGIGESIAEQIKKYNDFDWIEPEILYTQQHGINILFYTDENYPARLKKYDQSPLLLYYKGTECLNSKRTVGIIGTRDATDYGRKFTEKLISDLQAFQCVIVSGLAYGIDISAHKSAVKNQLPTVGVMGNGFDNIYPSLHKATAKKMTEQGGLLTEYTRDMIPDRNNFPARNRIVAALSDALVVVESAEEGGSMITVEYAHEYKKPVFALPGLFDAKYSAGSHMLIKNGHAMLIDQAADIINYLKWERDDILPNNSPTLFENLLPHELSIVQLLEEHGKLHIDQLGVMLDMPSHTFTFTLLDLEMKSLVKSLPGKYYEVCV